MPSFSRMQEPPKFTFANTAYVKPEDRQKPVKKVEPKPYQKAFTFELDLADATTCAIFIVYPDGHEYRIPGDYPREMCERIFADCKQRENAASKYEMRGVV